MMQLWWNYAFVLWYFFEYEFEIAFIILDEVPFFIYNLLVKFKYFINSFKENIQIFLQPFTKSPNILYHFLWRNNVISIKMLFYWFFCSKIADCWGLHLPSHLSKLFMQKRIRLVGPFRPILLLMILTLFPTDKISNFIGIIMTKNKL